MAELNGESADAGRLLLDAGAVDSLKVLSTKEYVEYSRDFEGEPHYKLRVPDIDILVERGDSKLVGRVFRLPHLGLEAIAKCEVKFSSIKLSLDVFSPEDSGAPTRVFPNVIVIIKPGNGSDSEATDDDGIVLACNVKSKTVPHSGFFYSFCDFNYAARMKNRGNSLILHLYVKKAFDVLEARVVRWKVDCSNRDFTDELGVTPFFYSHPEGFLAQVRLFLQGQQLAAEFRFLKRSSVIGNVKAHDRKFLINLVLINPLDARLNIVHALNFHRWYKPEFTHECSCIEQVVDVKQLLPCLTNNKLMVKIKLTYI